MAQIYRILNLFNNKCYIGQTINFRNRINKHKFMLRRNSHSNNFLQNAWNKYGCDNFKFEVIEECEKEILVEKEEYWVNFYNSCNRDCGYNLMKIIDKVQYHNDISKSKIKEARSKQITTQETREKLSKLYSGVGNPFYGKHHTPETIQKIKDNMPDMSGENSPNYGVHMGVGEENPGAKLTWNIVKEIRKIYSKGNITQLQLSKDYSVVPSTINAIVLNKKWVIN